MSVIVWDGEVLAGDRMMTAHGTCGTATKIWVHKKASPTHPPSAILACTGTLGPGIIMVDWWLAGADLKKYPSCQSNEKDWTRLIVASEGIVITYEVWPVPIRVESEKWAWGAGQDYALGALAAGADAIKAVKIASRFNESCGFGVDAFSSKTYERVNVDTSGS